MSGLQLTSLIGIWLGALSSNVYAILLYRLVGGLVYYAVPKRFRSLVLLLESLLFYGLADWRMLILLLAETLVTWEIGRKLAGPYVGTEETGKTDVTGGGQGAFEAADRARKRLRLLMTLGIVIPLGILLVFKYANFFADAFHLSETQSQILLPLGISYYTFREISYLADIALGKREAETSLLHYAAYVTFFPHMICGPIARSESMLTELKAGPSWNPKLAEEGFVLIVSGLFKKVVLADRMSTYVGTVFGTYEAYPSLALWMAAILYSLQLYCDFAGYSEIAVGVTRMYGLSCEKNFNLPYLSQDMQEFWRRWHISLSSWLRDYIYIPLGGNRKGKTRQKLHVMIVFLACGIWHGSSLRYPVWGLYHGICQIALPRYKNSRLVSDGLAEAGSTGSGGSHTSVFRENFCHLLRSLGVFLVSMFGWILFRAESFRDALLYVVGMFKRPAINLQVIQSSVLPFTSDNTCVAYFLTLCALLLVLFVMEWRDYAAGEKRGKIPLARTCFLILLIILLGVTGSGSFLYANY